MVDAHGVISLTREAVVRLAPTALDQRSLNPAKIIRLLRQLLMVQVLSQRKPNSFPTRAAGGKKVLTTSSHRDASGVPVIVREIIILVPSKSVSKCCLIAV